MLYFTKTRIILILIFSLTLAYFSFSNFIKFDDDIFKRNINLGLDLQGGSYLLLEVDNKPVINQKLQTKVIEIRNLIKSEKLNIKNLKLNDKTIFFETTETSIDEILKILRTITVKLIHIIRNLKLIN